MKKCCTKKKWIAGFGVLLAITYPLLTWVSGNLVEERLDRLHQESLKDIADYGKVTARTYERHFFRATETVEVELSQGLISTMEDMLKISLGTPIKITTSTHIKHGPLPGFLGFGAATFSSDITLDDTTEALLSERFKDRLSLQEATPFRISGGVSFLGKLSSNIHFSPFVFSNEEGRKITADALVVDAELSAEKEIRIAFSLPKLIQEGIIEDKFELADMRYNLRLKRYNEAYPQLFLIPEGSLSFAKLSFSSPHDPDKKPGTLEKLRVDFSLTEVPKEPLLNMPIKISFDRFIGEDKKEIGPFYNDFAFNRLSVSTVNALQKAWKYLSSSTISSKERKQTLLFVMRPELPAFLKAQPEFVLDRLQLKLPEGEAKFKGSLKLDTNDLNIESPIALFEKLHLSLDMVLDEKLTNDKQKKFFAPPYFKNENGKITSTLLLKDGKLIVNDQDVTTNVLPMIGILGALLGAS